MPVKAITKDFDALYKLSNLQDGSPQATKAMQALRKKFDEAPIVKDQLNKKVRISGYVVPLDASRDKYREFLLVPYFGACIHSPPPPANQIIVIKSGSQTKFTKLPESMDIVWIEGEIKESRVPTSQGMSGYAITAVTVLPYEEKGIDLPPASLTSVKFVKFVTMENDGHEEEQIYRRTDHWVLAASRSRHADQGVVPQRRL